MSKNAPRIDSWLTFSMLRLVVGIRDFGSLSASARAISIAQSNASRLLKVMERRLGYQLVQRSPRGSVLTREGQLTAQWAQEAIEALERFSAGTEALAHYEIEEVSIVSSMTIAEHLLPGWIRSFRIDHEQISTKLFVMNSAAVMENVASGTIALGFVETPVILPTLIATPILTDELVVVAAKDHPWAKQQKTLEVSELIQTPLIERETGSGTRAFLDSLVGDSRASPLLELNSNSAICQATIEGIGPTVLSRLAVDRHLRSGQLVEIPTSQPSFFRTLHAVWRADTQISDVVSDFVRIARTSEAPKTHFITKPAPHKKTPT